MARSTWLASRGVIPARALPQKGENCSTDSGVIGDSATTPEPKIASPTDVLQTIEPEATSFEGVVRTPILGRSESQQAVVEALTTSNLSLKESVGDKVAAGDDDDNDDEDGVEAGVATTILSVVGVVSSTCVESDPPVEIQAKPVNDVFDFCVSGIINSRVAFFCGKDTSIYIDE